jgi:acetyl esterase/lipase
VEPSAEAIEFNRQLEQLLSEYPRVDTIPAPVARSEREKGRSAFGPLRLSERAVERTIETEVGKLRLRCFLPDNPRGVYLHIHGGGWVLGGIHHQDPRLERLSDTCELAVLSVDYRLAPEFPYPAAPDDCEAAAMWVVENAADEFGTDRLLVGGESAGAHLSVVTLLRLRDRHDLTPFAGANLVYGAYDLRLSQSCRAWGERLLVLNTPITEYFVRSFVPADRLEDPDVSPMLADLTGLPPALFTVGTEDPLFDDTQLMFERWKAAGNNAELAVYPGGAHGFDAFPIALAEEALTRMYGFIERC